MDIMVDYWIRIQEAKKDRIHNTAFFKRKNKIVINPGGLVRRVDGDVRVDVARHCQRGSKNILDCIVCCQSSSTDADDDQEPAVDPLPHRQASLFNPLDGEGSVRELDVAVGREHKG